MNDSRPPNSDQHFAMSERRRGPGSRGGRVSRGRGRNCPPGGRGGRGRNHPPADLGGRGNIGPPASDSREEFDENAGLKEADSDFKVPKHVQSDQYPILTVCEVQSLMKHVTEKVGQTATTNNLKHGRCTNVSAKDVANNSHLSVNAQVNKTVGKVLHIFPPRSSKVKDK